MTRVVLASASTGRLSVLRQAGIDPLVVVSGVDEDAVAAELPPNPTHSDVVGTLARAKAEAVSRTLGDDVAADCVVIGCDSMLSVDGQLSGKPHSVAAARRQWESMAGRSAQLFSGHSVLRMVDGVVTHRESETSSTTVHFASPSAEELTAYLATGEPLGVAGAFTLDGLGGWFVDGIDGDPSTVVGIGLPLTRTLLRRVGLTIAALWAANPQR